MNCAAIPQMVSRWWALVEVDPPRGGRGAAGGSEGRQVGAVWASLASEMGSGIGSL